MCICSLELFISKYSDHFIDRRTSQNLYSKLLSAPTNKTNRSLEEDNAITFVLYIIK